MTKGRTFIENGKVTCIVKCGICGKIFNHNPKQAKKLMNLHIKFTHGGILESNNCIIRDTYCTGSGENIGELNSPIENNTNMSMLDLHN